MIFFLTFDNKVTETSYTIMYLAAGKQYKFRVKAENIAGIGKPSEATDEILAKEPFGKPFFVWRFIFESTRN